MTLLGIMSDIIFKLGPIWDTLDFKPNVLPLFEPSSGLAVLEKKVFAFQNWELVPSISPHSNHSPLAPAVR